MESRIVSHRIVAPPQAHPGYVYHSGHGCTAEETQIAKAIQRAEKRGDRWVEPRCADLHVKRDDGVWCEWTERDWYKVRSNTSNSK